MYTYLTITILTGTIEHINIKATKREQTSMPMVEADKHKNGNVSQVKQSTM